MHVFSRHWPQASVKSLEEPESKRLAVAVSNDQIIIIIENKAYRKRKIFPRLFVTCFERIDDHYDQLHIRFIQNFVEYL